MNIFIIIIFIKEQTNFFIVSTYLVLTMKNVSRYRWLILEQMCDYADEI